MQNISIINTVYYNLIFCYLIVAMLLQNDLNLFYRILCGNLHIIACKNHTGITFTE